MDKRRRKRLLLSHIRNLIGGFKEAYSLALANIGLHLETAFCKFFRELKYVTDSMDLSGKYYSRLLCKRKPRFNARISGGSMLQEYFL